MLVPMRTLLVMAFLAANTSCIVVTANHFWFDAAAGAAVACMAAATAHQLARLRPDAWSWSDEAIDEAPA